MEQGAPPPEAFVTTPFRGFKNSGLTQYAKDVFEFELIRNSMMGTCNLFCDVTQCDFVACYSLQRLRKLSIPNYIF